MEKKIPAQKMDGDDYSSLYHHPDALLQFPTHFYNAFLE
jgi:hypothetical protein